MELANVSNRILTSRLNAMLGTKYSESYISQVRGGRAGSKALLKLVKDETRAMLTEAVEATRPA